MGAGWAAACVVPAIVLHVEVREQPFAVLAFRALDPLAVVRTDADFQAEVLSSCALCTFAFSSFTFSPSFLLSFVEPWLRSHREFGSQACLP